MGRLTKKNKIEVMDGKKKGEERDEEMEKRNDIWLIG